MTARILLLKAKIAGSHTPDLFAEHVQVGGYTTKEGTYVAPHVAVRRKRHPAPQQDNAPSTEVMEAAQRLRESAEASGLHAAAGKIAQMMGAPSRMTLGMLHEVTQQAREELAARHGEDGEAREAAQRVLASAEAHGLKGAAEKLRAMLADPKLLTLDHLQEVMASAREEKPEARPTETETQPPAAAPDLLTADQATYERALYDAAQDAWDAGRSVTVATSGKTTIIRPRSRDLIRLHGDKVQMAQGRSWVNLVPGQAGDSMAGLLGLPTQYQRDSHRFMNSDHGEEEAKLNAAAVALRPLMDVREAARVASLADVADRQAEAAFQAADKELRAAGKRIGVTGFRLRDAMERADEMQRYGVDGDARIIDGVTYVLQGEPLRWHRAGDGAAPDLEAPAKPATITRWGVQPGVTKEERRAANARALDILRDKTDEQMTDEDRAALALYSGAGGVGDSLNEFYTPVPVATAMWNMLRAAGFSGGEVLEPSSGTGVFLHTAPEGARVSAVEMSPISSRIARILHGPAGHEVATASLERFATQDGRLFDAAIGNPPFGPRGDLIRDDKPDIGTAERYFVDTTLDKLRDGGLAALVLPTGVMDSRSGRAFRERILRKAEFLGGQRMPNTAFAASHTGVTTDVLLFRKRPQAAAGALSTLTQDQLRAAGVWDDDFLAGTYFTEGRGTGNVLGSLEPGWRAKAGMGNDITVEGSMDGVPEAIAGFQPEAPVAPTPDMPDILAALGNDPEARERAIAASQRPAYEPARPGDVRVIDGVRYVLQGEPPRWHRADEDLPLAVADAQSIAETLDDLVEGRSKDPAYTRIGLIESLDSYVATHGAPARNRQLREWLANPSMAQQEGVAPEDHPALVREMQRRVARLLGAVRPDGGYSDLVTGPKAQPQRQGSLDALAQQLSIEGGFTADSLARAAGKTREEALDHLFASPDYAIAADGLTWQAMNDYLSGELWPKLDAVRAAAQHEGIGPEYRARYEAQAMALEEAIAPQSLEDVEIAINSGFVTPDVLTAWIADRAEAANADPGRGWKVTPYSVTFDNGLYRFRTAEGRTPSGYELDADLLDRFLNRTGVKKDEQETVERLNREFRDWLLRSELREKVEERYNRTYRGYRAPTYSEAPIPIPGLNPPFEVNSYHWSGLRWALSAGRGIIAADVGLGKAQPLDAKVLTPTGWRLMGDLRVGDEVIAGDGTPTRIVGVFPQGEKDIWRVTFHDDATTECCDEHLWLTQTTVDRNNARRACADGGVPKVRSTAEIRATLRYLDREKNHTIPMVGPVQFPARPVPLDPYLVGALIGDGCLRDGTPMLTSADPEVVEAVRAVLPAGHALTPKASNDRKRAPSWRLSRTSPGAPNGVRAALDTLGLCVGSAEKRLPDLYTINEPAVRIALLQGLMDTDGYVCKFGVTVQFTTISERLARDVAALVQGLGGNATVRGKDTVYTHNGERKAGRRAYTVHMRLPPAINPFRLARKAERVRPKSKYLPTRYITAIEPAGRKPAQCIAVEHPSQLYVTDDFVVTHNTPRGLMLAAYAKATGKAKKPAFVVPKSVIANWMAEMGTWFPGASVLTIGETFTTTKDGTIKSRSDTAAERQQKLQLLAQNDYDFVFISQPAWNDIDVDPITKGQYVNSDFWTQRGDALGNAGSKRLNDIRTRYQQAIAGREFGKREDTLYFGDLGIDMVLMDEGHAYKNLFSAKNRFGESPKFLGGSGESNRALDTYYKTRQLRERNRDSGGVYMLTATPTKNSPLEVYSMLSHIAPEAFERMGIKNSEEFLDRFCEFETDTIVNLDGSVQDSLVVSGFKNLDELREVMRRFIDRKTAEDVGLVLPEADARTHAVDMSPEQLAVYADLRERAKQAALKKDSTGEDHIFSIMDKMQKAATDLSMLGEEHAGAASPKLEAVVRQARAGAEDGGQVIFAENLSTHERLLDMLVRAGVPREHIGVINAQATPSGAARQKVADAFNAGKVKYVIGNTATMGEGINLQRQTSDIHHVDLPWEPASMQQRNGRGRRQGNKRGSIRIHTYLAKRSFDAYRYQTIAAKKDWQDLLWNGGDKVENLAKQSLSSRHGDMLIMLADDPAEAAKAFAANKQAAEERRVAAEQGKALDAYKRLSDMEASIASLRQKGVKGDSLTRLEQKAAWQRDRLADNKHFLHKELLTSKEPALIDPEGGKVWQVGQGVELAGEESPAPYDMRQGPSRWVVERIDPAENKVTLRAWARPGARRVTTILPALRTGATTFAYSKEDELKALQEHIEGEATKAASAQEKTAQTTMTWAGLRDLPPELVERMAAAIQGRMKESVASYRDGASSTNYGFLTPDGEPHVAASYDARKILGTHSLMLPTATDREKAIRAYVAMEHRKKTDKRYVMVRGRHVAQPVRNYPGFEHGNDTRNPWHGVLEHQIGGDALAEAKRRHRTEVMDRAEAATGTAEALRHADPLLYGDYGMSRTLNAPVARLLWDKAREEGILDRPLRDALPHAVDLTGMSYVPSDLTVRRFLLTKLPPDEAAALREGSAA